MKGHLTIGALARAAGVPTSTVRYYEREGILRPRSRSKSNYRLYSEADLNRLRFIRAAQVTGFTLDDIAAILRPTSCTQVQARIEQRLAAVARRRKGLRQLERVLSGALEACRSHEQTGRCKVVSDLSASAAARPRDGVTLPSE